MSLPIAVVVVTQGAGMRDIFAGEGASRIIIGGDTMNPSVKDLVDSIDGAPSENVIILPNNRNIVPAAQQAVELCNKNARLVPTRSSPQGLAALLSLNSELDIDSNVAEMVAAMGSVKTGEITAAVRPVTLNGVDVNTGTLIGLLEQQLVLADQDILNLVESLLRLAEVEDEHLVTLYHGSPVGIDEARIIEQHVQEAFPNTEVRLHEGAQPHYHFVVSVE